MKAKARLSESQTIFCSIKLICDTICWRSNKESLRLEESKLLMTAACLNITQQQSSPRQDFKDLFRWETKSQTDYEKGDHGGKEMKLRF